jgi:hypothetical protein
MGLPTGAKSEKTKYKHQIANKFQISKKIKSRLIGVSDLGHCDLFVICHWCFEVCNC